MFVHKSINFTASWSPTEINFLDTTFKMDPDRKLYTTLYTNPTDTHTYLHYNSAHPLHQKRSGPYSQLVRVRRICTQFSDFLDNSKTILSYYAKRGNPQCLLDSALAKAKSLDRKILLIPTDLDPIQDQKDPVLVLTYIRKHWPILDQARSRTPVHNLNTIVAYRHPPNLKDKFWLSFKPLCEYHKKFLPNVSKNEHNRQSH